MSFTDLCLAQPATCQPSDLIFQSSFEGGAALMAVDLPAASFELGEPTVATEPALGAALIAAVLIKSLIGE